MLKKKNNQTISAGDGSVNLQAGRDINLFNIVIPTELVNQKITEEIKVLRQSRYFAEFDRVTSTLDFGRRVLEGNLSGGTDAVKAQAFIWCARILSGTDQLDRAEDYLMHAKNCGELSDIDIKIAEAFIISKKGDKKTAMKTLAQIDSPASRTVTFMVVAFHEGNKQAIDWLNSAKISAADLDADGNFLLVTRLLELGYWDNAKKAVDTISDQNFEEAPILHHVSALTNLLQAVPVDYRAGVLNQLPFYAKDFPLAADRLSINARKTAHHHFTKAALEAKRLNCPQAATANDEYALWLELIDPENADQGKKRLEGRLRHLNTALNLVPLGLQFGVRLELRAVEQEIERQIALNDGITLDAAIARFALAFTKKTPKDVAEYVSFHYDELAKHLDTKAIRCFQIEMLAKAGLPEKATEILTALRNDDLSKVEERRLQNMISEAEGADPIEIRKKQYQQSGLLSDLIALVNELEIINDWTALYEYGLLLFENTKSVTDAERLIIAYSNADKYDKIIEVIRDNIDLLSQSKKLQLIYSWALYHEGELLLAREELRKLNNARNDPYYRVLEINLAISLGDWNSLLTIVANEYQERSKRNATELIGVAQLAHHCGSPHAKELTYIAADKAGEDANILATAYYLAANAGWENEDEAVKWLHRAAELSGQNGPFQRINIQDILKQKPAWERRASEIWTLLRRGEIPMFIAAQSLNKCLVELILLPAFFNPEENDPRHRYDIPAYSGNRQITVLDSSFKTIGMDTTALLTLSFLNLLETVLNAFDLIYVPHSTLFWLFGEKQKAAFHQPSRIKNARKVFELLARDKLEKFVPTTVADSELSAQVGDELASMIAEAEKDREEDETQHIVVRPAPVHRLSPILEDEADLSDHSSVISSCMAVVDKLREKGQITAQVEKRAKDYLHLNEKPWAEQPKIKDGAVLYLDGLAVTYFLHIGILEKLHAAGFKVIASPREVAEDNALISYEGVFEKASEMIEHIRSVLNIGIESGKIKVGKQHDLDEPEQQARIEHPTVDILSLSSVCDAVVLDDRFFNQHSNIDIGEKQTSIFTTVDLLETLAAAGLLSGEKLLECLTLLRRAGYFFIPVTENELMKYMNAVTIENNQIIETAELKAIRENILQVRMRDWLQFPKELPWLEITLRVFINVLKAMWTEDTDQATVIARSNWIVDQIDIRGWAHSLGPGVGENVVKLGRGSQILLLLSLPFDTPENIKNAYFDWVEKRILSPIKDESPELFVWIVDYQKTLIAEMVEMKLTQENLI